MRRHATFIAVPTLLAFVSGCYPYVDQVWEPIEATVTRTDDAAWRITARVPADLLAEAARDDWGAWLNASLALQHGGVFVPVKTATVTVGDPITGETWSERVVVDRGRYGPTVDLFDLDLAAACMAFVDCSPRETDPPADTDPDTDLPTCEVERDCVVRRTVRVERGDRAGRLHLDGEVVLGVGSTAPFSSGQLDLEVTGP